MLRRLLTATLALASASTCLAQAQDFQEFSSQGLRGSQGVVVRVRHPAAWKRVATDDAMAVAELRGPHGPLTGILQIGRGRKRPDMESLCRPERARTMLQNPGAEEADARIMEVVARRSEGRAGYEIRYERNNGPAFLAARSLVVCLKDSRLVVSCGAMAARKTALGAIEPVCRQVLASVSISED
jgi:hypothetical protein